MSSILDALEKANRERSRRRGDPAGQDLSAERQALLERRLLEQQIRHRRQLVLALTVAGLLILLLAGSVMMAVLWQQRGSSPTGGPDGDSPLMAAVTTPAPEEPSPGTEQQPESTPTPTPSPTPEPRPTATPHPTPSPTPTPTPTPAATAVAGYIENAPRERDAAPPGSYTGIFQDGDIIRPVDIGLQVDGVMDMGTGLVALINGRQVRAGAKIGELHIVDVQFGVLTVDVGDGTVVRVRF